MFSALIGQLGALFPADPAQSVRKRADQQESGDEVHEEESLRLFLILPLFFLGPHVGLSGDSRGERQRIAEGRHLLRAQVTKQNMTSLIYTFSSSI